MKRTALKNVAAVNESMGIYWAHETKVNFYTGDLIRIKQISKILLIH